MEPTINKKEAFTVVGMLYHGKNENSEIAKMWREFHPRMEEIQDKVDPNVGYGVCGELEKSGAFKYLAGSGVTQATDIPEGMSVWEVPEQLYAVFPCTLSTIGDAYQFRTTEEINVHFICSFINNRYLYEKVWIVIKVFTTIHGPRPGTNKNIPGISATSVIFVGCRVITGRIKISTSGNFRIVFTRNNQ